MAPPPACTPPRGTVLTCVSVTGWAWTTEVVGTVGLWTVVCGELVFWLGRDSPEGPDSCCALCFGFGLGGGGGGGGCVCVGGAAGGGGVSSSPAYADEASARLSAALTDAVKINIRRIIGPPIGWWILRPKLRWGWRSSRRRDFHPIAADAQAAAARGGPSAASSWSVRAASTSAPCSAVHS